MEKFETRLEKEYVGKKVTVNMDEFEGEGYDFEWYDGWPEDDDPDFEGGDCIVSLDCRNYNLFDDDDDDEDSFYEDSQWELCTGINITIAGDKTIESISITADICCGGDSGLGECDPEDEWKEEDLLMAKEFLDAMIGKTEEQEDA